MSHYVSECNEELPPKTGKKGANMLILDEDSYVESWQCAEDQKDTGNLSKAILMTMRLTPKRPNM